MSDLATSGHLADCYCNGTGIRVDERVELFDREKFEADDDLGLFFRVSVESVSYDGSAFLRIEMFCRAPQPPRPEEAVT